jgi:hypothetical protein
VPSRKSAAYRRLQAKNKARTEAYKAHTTTDPSDVTYIQTLTSYIRDTIDKVIQEGLHFRDARVKEIVVRTRRATMRKYEVRNRGRIYEVTIEDKGKITGISTDDVEYGGSGADDFYGVDEEEE